MMEIGYKIITRKNRMSYINDNTAIHYPINKVAVPKLGDGPLALFNSLVKAVYIKSRETSLWYHYLGAKMTMNYKNLPEGTVLADAIMCLE